VSPSWRDCLLIGLAPECVAAVQLKRGLRPALGADSVRDCTPVPSGDAATPPWAAALATLDALLETLPRTSGNARVVLSSQFVRYVPVPWTDGVFAADDRRALAAGCFRTVHGDAVDAWQIVSGTPAYGRDNLAAAVDVALLAGLREIMARRRLRLTAVRPHLTAAFDRWRPRLAQADAGFVVVEPGCVTTLFRSRGRWTEVANRRCRAAAEAAQLVRQCVDADRVRGGTGGIVLLAPGTALEAELADGSSLRRLSGLAGPWPNDPWRSMAWSAA
jgi:hypothetical protein